jgi:hypothetical protein
MQGKTELTERQAAKRLQLAPVTLKIWRRKKIGPPYSRLSRGVIRYLVEDLDNYVRQCRVEPKGMRPMRAKKRSAEDPPEDGTREVSARRGSR